MFPLNLLGKCDNNIRKVYNQEECFYGKVYICNINFFRKV